MSSLNYEANNQTIRKKIDGISYDVWHYIRNKLEGIDELITLEGIDELITHLNHGNQELDDLQKPNETVWTTAKLKMFQCQHEALKEYHLVVLPTYGASKRNLYADIALLLWVVTKIRKIPQYQNYKLIAVIGTFDLSKAMKEWLIKRMQEFTSVLEEKIAVGFICSGRIYKKFSSSYQVVEEKEPYCLIYNHDGEPMIVNELLPSDAKNKRSSNYSWFKRSPLSVLQFFAHRKSRNFSNSVSLSGEELSILSTQYNVASSSAYRVLRSLKQLEVFSPYFQESSFQMNRTSLIKIALTDKMIRERWQRYNTYYVRYTDFTDIYKEFTSLDHTTQVFEHLKGQLHNFYGKETTYLSTQKPVAMLLGAKSINLLSKITRYHFNPTLDCHYLPGLAISNKKVLKELGLEICKQQDAHLWVYINASTTHPCAINHMGIPIADFWYQMLTLDLHKWKDLDACHYDGHKEQIHGLAEMLDNPSTMW